MSNSLEAKVVILGAQGVGKTSLVHRFVRNTFDPTIVSTIGADFLTKRVLDTTSETIVRLQLWDTAGQERFRSISRLYYRGANACVLCYDITNEESFQEMTGWLLELKQNLGPDNPTVIHVVGTKSDVVADDPSKRKVPFERTIAYVAEQLYPTQASTPPPSSGMGALSSSGTLVAGGGIESKRSSGFWGQDIGWDCCHEISAKDGEGIEEVFRVIARKLVEQRNKKREAETSQRAVSGSLSPPGARRREGVLSSHSDGGGSDANSDKRRSWLAFPPALVLNDDQEPDGEPTGTKKSRKAKCC